MQVRIPTGFRQFLRQLPNGEESYWEEGRRRKNGKRFGSFGERESQDKGETEIIRILAFFLQKIHFLGANNAAWLFLMRIL